MVYMACKEAALIHQGYTVLDGRADPLVASSSIPKAVGMILGLSFHKGEKLLRIRDVYNSGEEALKAKKSCVLWNLILNYAVNEQDHCLHDNGGGGLRSAKNF